MKFNEGTWENVQLNLKKKGTRCQGRDSGFAWRRRGGCGVRGSWGRACDVVAETTTRVFQGAVSAKFRLFQKRARRSPDATAQDSGRPQVTARRSPGPEAQPGGRLPAGRPDVSQGPRSQGPRSAGVGSCPCRTAGDPCERFKGRGECPLG